MAMNAGRRLRPVGGRARCWWSRARLPAVLDAGALRPAARRHVEGCLRCQAQVAAYRLLQRRLRAQRAEVVPAPAAFVTGVLAALDAAGSGAVRRPAARATATLAATSVVAAAVSLLWRRRGLIAGS